MDSDATDGNRPRRCIACGYDLRGLDPAGRCPECGEQITRACFECRLDVAGLDPKGYCPRCGVPITPVPEEQRLHNSDPAWLLKIDRGLSAVRLGFIGLVTGITSVCFTFGVAIVVGVLAGQMPSWLDSIFKWIAVGGLLLIVSSVLLIIYGLIKSAALEPVPGRRSLSKARSRTMRVLAALVAPAIALPFVSWMVWRNTQPLLLMTIDAICALVFALHALVFVRYLETLDRRSGQLRADHAKALDQIRIAPLGCGTIMLILGALTFYGAYRYGTPGSTRSAEPGISAMVMFVWIVSLIPLLRTRWNVRRARDLAAAKIAASATMPDSQFN